jgi:hypothetical protein
MAEKEVIETRSGSNGWGMALIAIALLAIAAVGYIYVSNEQKETNAVSGAAQAVSDTAKDVGDAVKPDGEK